MYRSFLSQSALDDVPSIALSKFHVFLLHQVANAMNEAFEYGVLEHRLLKWERCGHLLLIHPLPHLSRCQAVHVVVHAARCTTIRWLCWARGNLP